MGNLADKIILSMSVHGRVWVCSLTQALVEAAERHGDIFLYSPPSLFGRGKWHVEVKRQLRAVNSLYHVGPWD